MDLQLLSKLLRKDELNVLPVHPVSLSLALQPLPVSLSCSVGHFVTSVFSYVFKYR